MSVRSHTLAGMVVGFLAIGASAPLQAQDPAARPATPDTAKARADKKAAADRAAAGIHTPDTSGYRAMGDSTRAALAAECVNADSAGRPMTTGNQPRPADLPARTQGRTDTTRAGIAGDTARRTDSTSAMASRTTTPCPPADSARTGQTGATRDTTPGSRPFNRDSAQTAPHTTSRDQNQRIDSDSTPRDSTQGNTTTRGTSTTRNTTAPRAVTPPSTAAPR